MSRTFLIAAVLLCLAGGLYAATVYCPLHSYATCYDTGEMSPTGSSAHKWHCTCGDDIWVAPRPEPDSNDKKKEEEERADERNKKLIEAVDKNTKAIKDAASDAEFRQLNAETEAMIAAEEARRDQKAAPKPVAPPAASPLPTLSTATMEFPSNPTGEDLLRVCSDDEFSSKLTCRAFISGVIQTLPMGPGDAQYHIDIPDHTKFSEIEKTVIEYVKNEKLFLDGPQAAAKRIEASTFVIYALIMKWPLKQ